MPNPENITPHRFRKGQSGNPKGRPPKLPDLDVLLAKVLSEERNGMVHAELVLRAMLAKAAKGDVRAAELLLNRGFGKPKQAIDINSGDQPLSAPPISWITVPHVEPPR
jgi:hypothetical protein